MKRTCDHLAVVPTISKKQKTTPITYYAVKSGRTTGVFRSWDICRIQVDGYRNAVYKKFNTELEALQFVHETVPPVASTVVKNDAPIPTNKRVVIYSDGACSNNGRDNAKAGVGVWFGENDTRNISERLPGKQTNQRAELFAGLRALQIAKENRIEKVEIVTDSRYLVKGITEWIISWKAGNWKRQPKNEDLWKSLDAERENIDAKWRWVRGHSGVQGNDGADSLATAGAQKGGEETLQ